MTDVYLDVVGDWLCGAFKKVGQAVVHELHQKCWQASVRILINAKVLDNIWMAYGAQKLTLLLEPPHW